MVGECGGEVGQEGFVILNESQHSHKVVEQELGPGPRNRKTKCGCELKLNCFPAEARKGR